MKVNNIFNLIYNQQQLLTEDEKRKKERKFKALKIIGIIMILVGVICFLFISTLFFSGVFSPPDQFMPSNSEISLGVLFMVGGFIVFTAGMFIVSISSINSHILSNNMQNSPYFEKCSKCGNTIPKGSSECPYCKNETNEIMCEYCGSRNNISNKKCIICGAKINNKK